MKPMQKKFSKKSSSKKILSSSALFSKIPFAYFDYIVIGSGIAGLLSALSASKKGNVLLVTKTKLSSGSTPLAQGGIAAVLSSTDNFKKHISDTLKAGAHHNKKNVVEYIVKKAPEAIRKLTEFGINFEKKNGKFDLSLEGGHSKNRIVHVKDMTGAAIEETLIKNIRADRKITILENTFALDLIVEKKECKGVFIYKKRKKSQKISTKKINKILTNSIILATGGTGQIFSHTTNPVESTGDGIAIAARAGAKIQDMEFIQFHPTALAYIKNGRHFLLSEALRGEGAVLLNKYKKRFVRELLPRDIVTRKIYEERKKGPAYLTFQGKKESDIKKRFPGIYEHLKKNYGLNLAKDLIPVTPVAHYLCGGIAVDLKSRTSIKNLFAVGECAYTGLHGANRLASNSLLEAAVFAMEIEKHLPKIKKMDKKSQKKMTQIMNQKIKKIIEKIETLKMKNGLPDKKLSKKIQQIMWEKVGIIRTKKGLNGAFQELQKIRKNTEKNISPETKNLLETSLLICKQTIKRKKSLGCHWIEKF